MLWPMEHNQFRRYLAQCWCQVVALCDQLSLAPHPVSNRAVYKLDVPLHNTVDLPTPNSKAYDSYLEFTKSVSILYRF